jgi:hypothetical protein
VNGLYSGTQISFHTVEDFMKVMEVKHVAVIALRWATPVKVKLLN